jgi:hypothetical protein
MEEPDQIASSQKGKDISETCWATTREHEGINTTNHCKTGIVSFTTNTFLLKSSNSLLYGEDCL